MTFVAQHLYIQISTRLNNDSSLHTLFHSSWLKSLRSPKVVNLVHPALLMIISRPPSCSTVSFTSRTVSSTTPMSCPLSSMTEVLEDLGWDTCGLYNCGFHSEPFDFLGYLVGSLFAAHIVYSNVRTFCGKLLAYQRSKTSTCCQHHADKIRAAADLEPPVTNTFRPLSEYGILRWEMVSCDDCSIEDTGNLTVQAVSSSFDK